MSWRIIYLDLEGTSELSEKTFTDDSAARHAYADACVHAKEHGGHIKLMHGLECVARYVRISEND